MLTDSDLPVEAVARRVGYCDRSSLATTFRKSYGIHPKTYSNPI
ncbi:helix-turn-helix domain-containing protein [Leptolyngbya sp. PCC 6406]|nr:helix-turn-helix domain-containing protein [Leptolyngbya sp. PCC 6406]